MTRLLLVCALAACTPPPPADAPTTPGHRSFVALPVESDAFPRSAVLATNLLGRARLREMDPPTVTKVSLETVQLSIECNDPTIDCYVAVGHAVHANLMLFGVIEPGPKEGSLKLTVSLLDVDAKKMVHQATKVFADEVDAEYDMKLVVNEATKP